MSRAPRLPSDIDGLARLVEGVERDTYFDVQAQDAWHGAARRWPLVAAVLELTLEGGSRGTDRQRNDDGSAA
ncbi:hypothetical protein ACFPTO_13185 [Paraburkholderia denitrificans]|uniref:Uncharacterized protein n=1 Tax=Paraburkholderia denitrificans TaxID=694025 RepID=A0ABW0J9R4_9BURK